MSSVRTPVRFLIDGGRGHELVLAGPVVRQVVRPREPVLEVVGRQDGIVADLAQAGVAVGPDVRVGPHEDARVAHEAAQPPDGARPLPGALEAEGRRRASHQDPWRGQVRQQRLPHPDGSGARSAAAVGRRERLVDVEVHDVEAGLAGLEPAEDGVEVRAVHVGQRAGPVDGVEQLADARLEEPERRWIRDHHGGGPWTEGGPEGVDVDAAIAGRRDRDRPEARHRRGGGVRPVAAVGHEHLVAERVAPLPVVGPDHQDAGQLALGPGRGLERHGAHPGDLGQRRLELPEQLERALGDLVGRERMERREPGQAGRPFVELGVELHRARAERVEARCRPRSSVARG